MKKISLLAQLIFCTLLFSSLVSNAFALTATPPTNNSNFIQAQGKHLIYKGQQVLLKGTNFDNVPALGASIGSGNIDHIQITEADYAQLKANGGNHARFGLSFNWYKSDPVKFFQVLDQHIAWAKKNNVWLVLNMFTTPGNCYEGYSNVCGIWGSTSEQLELKNFWVDVAQHYYNEPVVAGYDLLNEPNPQAPNYCSTWFSLASNIRNAVVAVAPNQLVFIQTCSDPVGSLSYRNPPFGTNIVYEAHDYTPLSFTHNSTASYPGKANTWDGKSCTFNKSSFQGIHQTGDVSECPTYTNLYKIYGLEWAAAKNVPIYIGEWGATSSLNGYAQLHKDKAELYRDWGVSTAHYTWKHRTIVTGGSNQWGIYSNPLRLDDPAKLTAIQISWQDAVFPNFSSTQTTVTPTSCNEDVNVDHLIDLTDYSLLVKDFLKTAPLNPRSDINRDGIVDLTDYSLLVKRFLQTC